jgi:hypothetical protein
MMLHHRMAYHSLVTGHQQLTLVWLLLVRNLIVDFHASKMQLGKPSPRIFHLLRLVFPMVSHVRRGVFNSSFGRHTLLTLRSKKKTTKPRLVCGYAGCKSTFPRKYELHRHENTIHKQTVSMLCPVYGCNRAAEPFPRLDKFREHIGKKHRDSDTYLCLVETCRTGPLNRLQLRGHLESCHLYDHSTQPHFIDYIAAMPFLGVNLVTMQAYSFAAESNITKQRLVGKDVCPLENYGCGFRLSQTEPFMEAHLEKHTSEDFLRVCDEIGSVKPRWNFDSSQIYCPMCSHRMSDDTLHEFLHHLLMDHSEEERARAASGSCELKSQMHTFGFRTLKEFLEGVCNRPNPFTQSNYLSYWIAIGRGHLHPVML